MLLSRYNHIDEDKMCEAIKACSSHGNGSGKRYYAKTSRKEVIRPEDNNEMDFREMRRADLIWSRV